MSTDIVTETTPAALRNTYEDPAPILTEMLKAVQEIYPDYTRPDIDVEKTEVSADLPAYIEVRQDENGWFSATLMVADKAVTKSALTGTAAEALRSLREHPQLV